jgi:hypothetical protein
VSVGPGSGVVTHAPAPAVEAPARDDVPTGHDTHEPADWLDPDTAVYGGHVEKHELGCVAVYAT